MIVLAYFYPNYIRYETFSLFSLFWALVFVSYIAYNSRAIQEKMENKLKSYQASLESKVENSIEEIEKLNIDLYETQIEIVERLGTLGEFRSKETGLHVKRVGLYAKHLALLANVDEKKALLYERAAPLHDIGKVGIEDAILNKPANFTTQEYEIMKEHALIGESILSGSDKPLIQMAAQIAGGHHEKYDGSGYPRNLKAKEIPLCARIVAIVDVFDALYSSRVYKDAWNNENIITHYKEQNGVHFDPELTEIFLNNIDSFVDIYNENSN